MFFEAHTSVIIPRMKHIIALLLNGLGVYLSAVLLNMLFPAITPVFVRDYPVAIIASLAIGLLNLTIRPILKIVTLPINLITLGLFGLIINGACILIVPYIVNIFSPGGFVVAGLLWAIVFSALVSFVQSTLTALIK